MLVHAHPDDEAIPTGATMARYAAQGGQVFLVTCTRGEHGEVVTDELATLRDEGPEALGKHRETELTAALAELGVRRHEWLGGPGRWWDSGMAGTPENSDPRAFARADLGEAVRAMVAILRRERPHVVISDNDRGSYGHPDHVQAHRVTAAAVAAAADPGYAADLGEPWEVAKVYWSALPRSAVQRLVDQGVWPIEDEMPGIPDDEVTTQIDGRAHFGPKLAALRAHRSQVNLENGIFAFVVQSPEFALEHFQLVRGLRGPGSVGEFGWENDLFAGLAQG
ncbi:MAG: N-acetyl-1-D-myo-inositol-2-amino-2-deoxy-alpha-D-glucopyranoside deacetylase [Actinomycetota bacterium]|nr:N-acetyl-1-D-myo-inositol-2-amino-2-deoxy-alpha-D-glucopyranoside deacetylase [Actinomycetota bacterium]